jgi:hypothetical protein
MLLSGVLFVLFLAGCWLYCLTDAALTPAREYRGRLPKRTWIFLITATFIIGAIAWLIARRAWRASPWTSSQALLTLASHGDEDFTWYERWTAADDAIARHPAGRSRNTAGDGCTVPKGPDDDPEFLRQLGHHIRGTSGELTPRRNR